MFGRVAPSRSRDKSDASFAPTSRPRPRQDPARDTPVAARATKTERRRPVIKAGASTIMFYRSMHTPPTLARGPTGKAVLALEVRSHTSRRLHGHAPWTLRGGSDGQLTCTYM